MSKNELKIYAFDFFYEGAVVVVAKNKEEAIGLLKEKCEKNNISLSIEKDGSLELESSGLIECEEHLISNGLLFSFAGDTWLCEKLNKK